MQYLSSSSSASVSCARRSTAIVFTCGISRFCYMHATRWYKNKFYLQREHFFYSISYSLLHRPLITYCSIVTRSVVSYPLSRLFMSHSIDLVFHSQPFHFESGVTKHLLAPHHSYISWMAWSPSTFTSGKTPFSYKHRATNYVPLLRMRMFFARSNNLI